MVSGCPETWASTPRDWRKVHLGIDTQTLEVPAIEITGSRIGDALMLPDQIPAEQPLGIVTANCACDTRVCHRFTALGCPLTQPAGLVCPRKGIPRHSAHLRNKVD